MRLLDLFCGKFGWGKVFAERGWDVIGVDLIEPAEIPDGCSFINADILTWDEGNIKSGGFDFICASSPCEEFSIHGMAHFHPNPKYPSLGIELFNHTRAICEASGHLYIMENVRPAQKFVGIAFNHCGPFYLWGNTVPPLFPQGITKGIKVGTGSATHGMTLEEKRVYRKQHPWSQAGSKTKARRAMTANAATIPPLLANAVATYAERIIGDKRNHER